MFKIKRTSFGWAHFMLFVLFSLTVRASMQMVPSDPGMRGGPPGAGGTLPGLTVKESKFFDEGKDAFEEVQSVTGSVPGTEAGLGPRFNSNSCVSCHSQPAVGGSSPATNNPQLTVGGTNIVPFFIKEGGPVREARFKYVDSNRSVRDGGVHALFTITGRSDAPGCNIAQPDFLAASGADNLVFRIPTPTFGAGLIESIRDSTILANKTANQAAKTALGISGHENREGNTGTITRFGWKAQNKSLIIFSGEAYNVEQGVTNELFPQERDETPTCLFNATPEDHMNYEETQPQKISSDAVNFGNFMLFLAPPTPIALSASAMNGKALFTSDAVGCALCHTPSMSTSTISSAALNGKTAALYSDLLVHHMGSLLADDIIQGSAGPDEFRTAPLWGIGQRKFFLHDGRTSDLLDAIHQHKSSGSEASDSVKAFDSLSPQARQDILNFLRSL